MALLSGKGLFLKITFFPRYCPPASNPLAHNGRQCFELMHLLGSHRLCSIGYKVNYGSHSGCQWPQMSPHAGKCRTVENLKFLGWEKRQFQYFTELTLDGKMRIILCCSPCKLMVNFTAREVQQEPIRLGFCYCYSNTENKWDLLFMFLCLCP